MHMEMEPPAISDYYHPHTKLWGKVIFSLASVIVSTVGGGGSAFQQCHGQGDAL